MPPRLQILPQTLQRGLLRPTLSQPSQLALAFSQLQLQPQSQSRNAHILASLSDTPGAYNKRIRRGRGPASGKGKTSGRGHKGQGQHGKVPARFNGGQTPDIIVHGERGQDNIFALDLAPANLDRIQQWIDQGRIDPTKPITIRELAKSRCIHKAREGVKLLARGVEKSPRPTATDLQPASEAAAATPAHPLIAKTILKQPIHIVVSRASASAIAAVEAAGGTVTTRFYTRSSIARIMKRQTHPFLSSSWSVASGNEGLYAAAGLTSSIAPATTPAPESASAPAAASPGEAEAASTAFAIIESQIMADQGFTYRLPDPTKRRDIEYYRDPAHRGYLAHLLKPLEGPSLFFRSPVERKSMAGVKKVKVLPENRLW
ncbi:ribosomal protein L18e/L15P [Aspergillus californicus]